MIRRCHSATHGDILELIRVLTTTVHIEFNCVLKSMTDQYICVLTAFFL